MLGEIKIVTDQIAERLDELVDLGEIWNKHRKAKRMPRGVRQAMITVSREICFMDDLEKRQLSGVRVNDGQNNEGDLVDNS